MQPIRIRYHRAWGPALLALSAVNVVMFALWGGPMQLGLAVMLGVMGLLYLVQPFMVIGDGLVKVKNLFGLTLRTFPYERLADFEVERDTVVVGGVLGRRRLKLSLAMIRRGDLDRLAAAIRAARAADAADAADAAGSPATSAPPGAARADADGDDDVTTN